MLGLTFRQGTARVEEPTHAVCVLAGISAVMAGINRVLDDSIAADGFYIRETPGGKGDRPGVIDISAIDFEA